MTLKQVSKYLQIDKHIIYKLSCSSQITSLKNICQWQFKKYIIDKEINEKSQESILQNKVSPTSSKKIK